ncbi:hypothetical protein ACFZA2_11850 [Microbacterium sp. NPDC007973]|uniref:hypothetical protein n=1 Tax=Microbacterium sp. NPDC007973 TaxID=3364182 RepID=UPI0036EF9FA4
MPDPRALRIDVGPFHFAPTPDASTWTAEQERGGRGAASGIDADGTDAGRITAGWTDWVAFAQRVLQADALWRDVEARGDAWDEGFSAARDVEARNPYR